MRKATITRLIFVPTGSYHDMALRPYTARVTGEDMDTLERSTSGFKNVSVGALSGIAGSILRPSTMDVGTLSIDNGWNEHRYMFMMEVVYPNTSEYAVEDVALNVKYVSGYTDRLGDVSYSGHIDPRMRMYLTTVIDTNEVRTSRGVRRRPVGANRYLQQNGGQDRSRNERFFALRPRDVCAQIGNNNLGEYFVDTDFTSALGARPLLSNINNDLPTDYLSRAFSAYRTAANDVNNDFGDDIPSLMRNTGTFTRDSAAMDDSFVTELFRNTELSEGSCFSYGELCQLFDGTDRQATIIKPAGDMQRDIGFASHQPNDTQHWHGTDNETLIATIAGSAIQALMVGALLTQVSFTVSNDTVNGETTFQWHSAPESFILTEQSLEDQMLYFEDRLRNEVFMDMSRRGNLCLTLSVFSDLVRDDTRLEVNVDGQGAVPYCMPNFASSLITPVVGNNRTQLDTLASSFHDIFTGMGGGAMDAPSNTTFADAFTAGGTSLGSALKTRTAPSNTKPSSGEGWL